jgi:hypothetical protein
MKHDLTTGTWQDDTGCPISIILATTSDVADKIGLGLYCTISLFGINGRGCAHKIGHFFFFLKDFLCMNGVDICAPMSPLIFFEKNPSGVSSAEHFASFD